MAAYLWNSASWQNRDRGCEEERFANANISSTIFVPIAIGLAVAITTVSKKYLHKQLSGEQLAKEESRSENT